MKQLLGSIQSLPVQSGGRDFIHLWEITEVIPNERIAYSWNYEGYAGRSHVTFELFEDGSMTTLRLTHTISEPFPQDIPEFRRDSCEAGWNYFIKETTRAFPF